MAHFARIENNKVTEVIVADTKEWCESVLGGEWIQTSYNTRGNKHNAGGVPLRKNYAGIGYTYDREKDVFIPPQPFPSWELDGETCLWKSPVPKPEEKDNFFLGWNEEKLEWEYFERKNINI